MIESLLFITCALTALILSKYRNLYWIPALIAILLLVAAGLRTGVGTDTQRYLEVYSSLEMLELNMELSLLYTFFFYLRPYFESPYTFTLLIAFFQIIIIYIIGRDYRYTVFLVIYISFFLITYSFNQIRQGLADLIAVLLFSLPLFYKKNLISGIFIASIHPISGCIRIMIGYLHKINSKKNLLLIFFTIAAISTAVITFKYDSNIIFIRYMDYLIDNPEGLQQFNYYPYFYIKTLILIIIISYGYTRKYLQIKFLYLYLFLVLLVSIMPILNRAVDSIIIYFLAILATKGMLSKNIPRLLLNIAVIIGIVGTLRFMWINYDQEAGCAKWLPYETLFNSIDCMM
jgi:hypothetical protein